MLNDHERPITAAFYLPQFHAIPENDAWWGEGFTEWRNVARAEPAFPGHHHPARPVTPFGEYSLLEPGVVEWQTALAQAHDIDAFVYYHYWFDGRRLLEKPLDNYLRTELTHQFAICWANENWTRRWDGKQHDVLMAQRYDGATPLQVFDSFDSYLLDPRYLRNNGRAVLMVHRADQLPDPREYARVWRAEAMRRGVGELSLVASETTHGLDPRTLGFDAVVEFPPVGDSTLKTVLPRRPEGVVRGFRGRFNSYDRLADVYMSRSEPPFPRHRTVVPRWDNTARRGANATCFVGSTPQRYAEWLDFARRAERSTRGSGGLVMINAWNEWAEGAYLEPDDRFGNEYLVASRWDSQVPSESGPTTRKGGPNVRGIMVSAAGSVKGRSFQWGRAVARRMNERT